MDFIAKFGSSPVDRSSVEAHDADGNPSTVELDGYRDTGLCLQNHERIPHGQPVVLPGL